MTPIIICGMHRSGTSLLCRALETAGLFTGEVKEHNHEAVFFLTLNQWIFEQLGATWDNTYNMRFLNEDLSAYLLAVMGNVLKSPSAASFTGSDQCQPDMFYADRGIAWGWKDPRNTFTAPLWKQIFPDAKLIHVCRTPLDGADSLRRREHEIQARHQAQLAGIPAEQLDGSMRFQQSPRLFHLEEGMAVWEEYTSQALLLERQFGASAIRLRYEDFLARPVTELARLAEFAGLDTNEEQLQAAVTEVNPQRRCAFTGNNELLACYRAYQDRDIMRQLGYDALDKESVTTAA